MTGCYPKRVSMDLTDGAVLRPISRIGLHPNELTVAELLKSGGYATAAFGKWHLGDQPEFLPTRQGFDTYLGIPYSDDMTPRDGVDWPPLPLMNGETVIEAPTDRDLLTKRLTENAVSWIESHADEPFFLYFPQSMPGSTRAPFASEEFKGKSRNGPWGDSVEELDWSVGEIVSALDRLKLTDNTLLIWTSDNGAPRRKPPQGLNHPLAGWGYSVAEGGMRVPCIMKWPGRIPANRQCDELTTLMDLFPTFAAASGVGVGQNHRPDGYNILPLMEGKSTTSPYSRFLYYRTNQLQAIRSGKWKWYLPTKKTKGRLFDVVADPGETKNVVAQHAAVVQRLIQLADQAEADLGQGTKLGPGCRPAGRASDPKPLVLQRN
jgi:arylsulfatase A